MLGVGAAEPGPRWKRNEVEADRQSDLLLERNAEQVRKPLHILFFNHTTYLFPSLSSLLTTTAQKTVRETSLGTEP